MQDRKEFDIVSVTTTVASHQDALRLARAVVERRLGACAQVEGGLTSVYRWQDRLCEDAEVRVVIKTLDEHLPALQALFAQEHPYELPQFTVARLGASAAYAQWVRGEAPPPA